MEPKFTLRDIFAYFFVGFYFALCLYCLPQTRTDVIDFLESRTLELTAIPPVSGLGLLLIPLIYFVGLVIQGIDNIVYYLSYKIYKMLSHSKYCTLSAIINKLLFGHRYSYYLENKYSIDIVNKIHKSDDENAYWNAVLQSTEGLYRASVILFWYSIFYESRDGYCNIICGTVFVLMMLVFWTKARMVIAQDINEPDETHN